MRALGAVQVGVNMLLALCAVAAATRAATMLGNGGGAPLAWWAVLLSASVEFAALVAACIGRLM